jgi:NADPH:quinone reductase-like Zn-dependent oxidoreductase
VVAATRRQDARDTALARGATAVVDLADGDADELLNRMRAATDSVDVVVDPVCGPATTAAIELLAERGRLVQLGSSGGPTATFASATLRSRSASILGYTNTAITDGERAEALGAVFALVAAGRLQVSHEVLPLDDVAEGWRRTTGSNPRVVVVPSELG